MPYWHTENPFPMIEVGGPATCPMGGVSPKFHLHFGDLLGPTRWQPSMQKSLGSNPNIMKVAVAIIIISRSISRMVAHEDLQKTQKAPPEKQKYLWKKLLKSTVRTLEIKQRLAVIYKAFVQENGWVLGRVASSLPCALLQSSSL